MMQINLYNEQIINKELKNFILTDQKIKKFPLVFFYYCICIYIYLYGELCTQPKWSRINKYYEKWVGLHRKENGNIEGKF